MHHTRSRKQNSLIYEYGLKAAKSNDPTSRYKTGLNTWILTTKEGLKLTKSLY